MNVRSFHLWCAGVALFGLALLRWVGLFALAWRQPRDIDALAWHEAGRWWPPLLAAVIGFVAPIVCLWKLRRPRARVWATAFVLYLAVMLAWGVVDIRYRNWQIGGHCYPHVYATWWFMPYRWIEEAVE